MSLEPAPASVQPHERSVTRDVEPRIGQLFTDAAIGGERAMSWVRLVFCGVAMLRELAFNLEPILQANTRDVMAVTFLALAVLGSVVLLRLPPSNARQVRRRLALAVALDTVVILGATSVVVVFPTPSHRGMFYSPFLLIYPALITASGFRLSRFIVLLSSVFTSVVLGALVAWDVTHNAAQVSYPPGHSVFVVLVMLMASAMAYLMTTRARGLVNTAAGIVLEVARVRERLGAYVSHEVAEHALSAEKFTMGGRRMNVAVLFSDLRGFTAWSEHLTPEQLVTELNAYLETMVLAIHAHGGVVDKYVGDSIMAVFGAPQSRGDDAACALRAARAMEEALRNHNEERARANLPPLAQGVGVHFGPVVAGNVGTSRHAQYTVIGDTVNLASRLQSATKEHKTGILVSDELRQEAERQPGSRPLPALSQVGEITVRGREAPVLVWTLKG
jgi:class 3 adenylate cyclase